MQDHFVRVGKSVGNPEMLGRFVGGFLAACADRRDLELRKRTQGRNVGIAPPAVAHTCSNDANADFSVAMMIFPQVALYSQADPVPETAIGNFKMRRPHDQGDRSPPLVAKPRLDEIA